MSFYAIGTGFFQRRQQIVDEERDEARERRRLASEAWLKDTLPRIRAAREKDLKAVELMNTGVADTFFSKNPEILFHATKSYMAAGSQGDFLGYLNDYKSRLDTNFNIPPETLKAAREKMSGVFDYTQTGDTFSGFALKNVPETPAFPSAPAAGGTPGRSSMLDSLFARRKAGTEMRDFQEGSEFAAGAVGESVNARTTSRFAAAQVPSNVVKFREKDDDTLFDAKLRLAISSKHLQKDPNGLSRAMGQGRDALNEYLDDPTNFYSQGELDDIEFNKTFKKASMQYLLENSDPTVVGTIISSSFDSEGNVNQARLASALSAAQLDITEKEATQQFLQAIGNPQDLIDLANSGLLQKVPEKISSQENLAAMVEMAAMQVVMGRDKDRVNQANDAGLDPDTASNFELAGVSGQGMEWLNSALPAPTEPAPDRRQPENIVEAFEQASSSDGIFLVQEPVTEEETELYPYNTAKEVLAMVGTNREEDIQKADPTAVLDAAEEKPAGFFSTPTGPDVRARTIMARNISVSQETVNSMSLEDVKALIRRIQTNFGPLLKKERQYSSAEEAIADPDLHVGGVYVVKTGDKYEYGIKIPLNPPEEAIRALNANPTDANRRMFEKTFNVPADDYIDN